MKKILFFLYLIFASGKIFPRNVHRRLDPKTSYIIIQEGGDQRSFILRDSHLREIPLFKTFNSAYCKDHFLPQEPITFRHFESQIVSGKTLNKLIEEVLKEIQLRKKKLTHFTQLKMRDFNWVSCTGLAILKFNDYPFVLKLFIEKADSFSKPNAKAFQVRGVFTMGGSIRHLSGFTRVKNAEEATRQIAQNAYWSTKAFVPRKWFWLPANQHWFTITGHNIGNSASQTIKIPGIYGIVTDFIEQDKKIVPSAQECLDLCAFLEFIIDPHEVNFFIEKQSKKIAIIDTEHFPSLIGLTQKVKPPRTYTEWYKRLGKHYLKQKLFCLKDERYKRQMKYESYYMP